MGYYQAWTYIVVFGLATIDSSGIAPLTETHLRMLFSGTIALALVAAMFIEHRLDMLKKGRWLIGTSGCAVSIGTVFLSLPSSNNVEVALCVAGVLLVSAGNAILLLSWIEYIALGRRPDQFDYVLLSYPFSAVLVSLALLMPEELVLALAVILPVLSAMTLMLCDSEERLSGSADFLDFESAALWRKPMTRVLTACLVVSAAFGAVRAMPQTAGAMGAPFGIYWVVAAVFIAVYFSLHATSDKTQLVMRVYRLCFPVLILCYLLLLLVPAAFDWLVVALLMAASFLFEMFVWLMCPLVVFERGLSMLHIFGWGATAFHVGSFFGLLAGDWLDRAIGAESAPLVICIGSASILVIVMAYVFREQGLSELIAPKSNGSSSSVPTDNIPTVCAELVAEFGISEREAQVLELLARGRSVPFIEQELGVSASTVKTHVRHIYQKLGVHTKQELLDLFG